MSYQYPVSITQCGIAIEAVVNKWYCCSPHQQDDALEIELGSERIYLLAMAHHCVVAAMIYQSEVGTQNSEKNSSNIADKQKHIVTPMK